MKEKNKFLFLISSIFIIMLFLGISNKDNNQMTTDIDNKETEDINNVKELPGASDGINNYGINKLDLIDDAFGNLDDWVEDESTDGDVRAQAGTCRFSTAAESEYASITHDPISRHLHANVTFDYHTWSGSSSTRSLRLL